MTFMSPNQHRRSTKGSILCAVEHQPTLVISLFITNLWHCSARNRC